MRPSEPCQNQSQDKRNVVVPQKDEIKIQIQRQIKKKIKKKDPITENAQPAPSAPSWRIHNAYLS